jgi:hypothetical protein
MPDRQRAVCEMWIGFLLVGAAVLSALKAFSEAAREEFGAF